VKRGTDTGARIYPAEVEAAVNAQIPPGIVAELALHGWNACGTPPASEHPHYRPSGAAFGNCYFRRPFGWQRKGLVMKVTTMHIAKPGTDVVTTYCGSSLYTVRVATRHPTGNRQEYCPACMDQFLRARRDALPCQKCEHLAEKHFTKARGYGKCRAENCRCSWFSTSTGTWEDSH
jgi:hypothetical protein